MTFKASDGLTEFIQTKITHNSGVEITPDLNLMETGLVDSMGLMRIVAYIEETHGFKVPTLDIILENFENIGAMANYIQAKQSNS